MRFTALKRSIDKMFFVLAACPYQIENKDFKKF
jgi:hypothetical protein